jgi:hypothetical protein
LDKKGFLFTVTVFLVLTYILLSISVWVKGVEASERAFSEFYKESTVELAIEQITPAKMDKVTNTIMQRSLHRLNEHSIDHTVLQGPPEDEYQNVRGAMFELLTTGAADSSYFKGADGIPSEANSSLSNWATNLNASLLAIGVQLTEFEVSKFQINQSAKDLVNYSFVIKLQMKDLSNTSAVTREYHINNTLDITGLVDPALARESKQDAGDDLTAYRMFFFHDDYPMADDMVSQVDSGEGGQDWVYGPLMLANGSADLVPLFSSRVPDERRYHILVGTYDEIESLGRSTYNKFAGYIVTTRPTGVMTDCGLDEFDTFNPVRHTEEPECEPYLGEPSVGKPFMIVPGFNPVSAPECPLLNSNETRRCVLMVNNYLPDEVEADPTLKDDASGTGLYDVEEFRDFVMCGYYTHNPDAPSYMQRLLNDSYLRNHSDFGIETFVIGNYANSSAYDLYSRLDRELFYEVSGDKIRGLPGCKDHSMCADDPVTGIFVASDPTQAEYGLDDISCETGAGCD